MEWQSAALPDDIDPVVVGAASGLLWAGAEVTLAGVGEAARVPLARPEGAAVTQRVLAALDPLADPDAHPAHGVVAFGALPFDPSAPSELVVPRIVVGTDRSGSRWITALDGSIGDAIDEVNGLVDSAPVAALVPDRTVTSAIPREAWRDEVVAVARDRIRAGELRKAVLAREVLVKGPTPIDQADAVLRLRHRFPHTNLFAFDGFVGASPELLVERLGLTVRAHPLAGTMPRRVDPAADRATVAELIASTKDQWEHRITIDWLLDTLLPFCSYVDAEPEPTVVSLANVHHLGTRVDGVLSSPSASVLELVAALHPTPALGGDPQQAALDLIAQLEPGDRGRYGGAVGWVDGSGNGAFAVAIRSAQISGSTASLWAGGGMVADSDPPTELAETDAKFEAMLSVLVPGE